MRLINFPGEPGSRRTQDFLEKQWGQGQKNTAAQVALNMLNFPLNVIIHILAEQVASRVINFIYATYNLVRGNSKQAIAFYQDSLVNGPGLLADAISDVGTLVKQFFYASAPTSSRIRLCTTNIVLPDNLTPDLRYMRASYLRFINPMVHVGVIIDQGPHRGGYETLDPKSYNYLTKASEAGGDVRCQYVPLMSGESESLAIERLECVDREYWNAEYGFFAYNCGGYTKDILEWSGLGYALYANLGIGSDFSGKDIKNAESHRQRIAGKCDSHIASIRNIIDALEKGQEMNPASSLFLFKSSVWFSSDVIAQLTVSAARGKNDLNRVIIVATLGYSNSISFKNIEEKFAVYSDNSEGMSSGKENTAKLLLREMFRGLDQEALGWLAQTAPLLYKLARE